MSFFRVLLAAALIAGCGSEDDAPIPTVPSCEAQGDCKQACVAGQIALDDGSCRDAGVGADQCADGFVHGGDRSCEPVLPSEACPAGTIAVPGDESCRLLADCGSGTWGNIPTDSATEHVDASYMGGDGDGSAAKPWSTIQAAISAAAAAAIVAIAEGSYPGDVAVQGKAITLWGRCPELVAIVGAGTNTAALTVAATDGMVVRGVAIRGPEVGIIASGSTNLLVEDVWLEKNGWRGIELQESVGPVSATVRNTLVEGALEAGIRSGGADVVVERSVVRDTALSTGGTFGRGISLERAAMPGARPTAQVVGSLIENNHTAGIFADALDLVVQATVVRGTESNGIGAFGRAISAQAALGGERATVQVDGSLLEDSLNIGISVSKSDLTMTTTTVRGTRPAPVDGAGWGVLAQEGSTLTLASSLVGDNTEVGVVVLDSQGTLESVAVRDTGAFDGRLGHGMQLQASGGGEMAASVYGCVVERSVQMGIAVVAGSVAIDSTLVVDTAANEGDRYGDGVMVLSDPKPAELQLFASRVDGSARAGLSIFGAQVSMGSVELTCGAFDIDGELSDGQSFSLEDQGGNLCGCPMADGECKALSAGLTPPEPVGEP